MTLLAPDDGYDEIDLEALNRAIRIVKFSDPERAEQMNSMLRDRPWGEVAEFAAMCCQIKALGLRPFELAPCLAADEAGEQLLDRMLEAGLSQWEPDPVAALKRAKSW